MAPELFAVSYAGAPKIVVTDFVDEVRLSVVQSGAYAVDATRLHLLMKWVVSFSILSRFGPLVDVGTPSSRRGRESARSRRWRGGGR